MQLSMPFSRVGPESFRGSDQYLPTATLVRFDHCIQCALAGNQTLNLSLGSTWLCTLGRCLLDTSDFWTGRHDELCLKRAGIEKSRERRDRLSCNFAVKLAANPAFADWLPLNESNSVERQLCKVNYYQKKIARTERVPLHFKFLCKRRRATTK